MAIRLHPIIERMNLSKEQELAVTSRGSDTMITAGAGSGKTKCLVARYLSLLTDQRLPARSIAAVTFTKKAAREMRNRVRHQIGDYLATEHLDDANRRLWETRYRELDAARIGTIHSLCAEVLRLHPAEARLDPDFEVLDANPSAALRARAIYGAMAWAANDRQTGAEPGVAELYPFLKIEGFESLLSRLLSRRLDVRAALDAAPADPWPRWRTTGIDRLVAFLDDPDVIDGFVVLEATAEDGTLAQAELVGDALAPMLRHLLARWGTIQQARGTDDWIAVSVLTSELQSYLKSKGRKANWQPHPVKEVVSELKQLYAQHLDWMPSDGVSLGLDRQASEMLPPLRRAFDQTSTIYEQLKATSPAQDFDDLEQKALDLLQNSGSVEILSHWRGEIRALLVDEFQDTNDRQRRLIRALAGDAQKLFLVGDALQSIYRFRGADVTVSGEEEIQIRAEGGRVTDLLTCYRAHAPLLQSLNELLRPILPTVDDSDRPWRKPFRELKPYRQRPPAGLPGPYIEMHLAVGTKASGALKRAGLAVAQRLIELVESQRVVLSDSPDEGSSARKLGYGDVAILCRASSSFEAYENALDQAGVPYITVAGRGFYERPVVRDLLNALQALADPTDDLALAGMLRSPAFALSDAALFYLTDWQQQPARKDDHRSLWQVLTELSSELPSPDNQRASRAIGIIEGVRASIGRRSVAGVLKDLLDATSYRAILHRAGLRRAARNVDKLLLDARTSRRVSIGEFLEYTRTLRDAGTREGEARVAGASAVQIMSIHAAKGLEFPVVVLGDLGYAARSRSPVFLTDPDLGLLLRAKDADGRRPLMYQLALASEQDKEEAESRRLLYVAATRARDLLLLSASVGLTKKGRIKLSGWLRWLAQESCVGLAGAVPPIDESTQEPVVMDVALCGRPIACTIYPAAYVPPVRRIPAPQEEATRIPVPPPLLDQESGITSAETRKTRRPEQDEPPEWAQPTTPAHARSSSIAIAVGSLTHAALRHWYFPDEDFDTWATAWLNRHEPVDSKLTRAAVAETRRILERFRTHRLYLEMTESQLMHEVPYSVLKDGQLRKGRIDALYRGGDGGWTLVEFKTTRIRNAEQLERYLASEEHEKATQQARGYARDVIDLLGQKPKALICLLNCWGEVRVEEV